MKIKPSSTFDPLSADPSQVLPSAALQGMSISVGLNAVIVAVTEEQPRILTVSRTALGSTILDPKRGDVLVDALPYGPLDPASDRTLELTLRGWVREQTGIEMGYVEQLYTFGDRHRDPRERRGGPRVLSVGYLALWQEGRAAVEGQAGWRDGYDYFPWEDWREGRPAIFAKLLPALEEWVDSAPEGQRRSRRERVDIAFGLGGATWDGNRVLDRYELLYEARLVREAWSDLELEVPEGAVTVGREMALDHRRIVATAFGRLRGKITYRPVVFELLGSTFTLLHLQRIVEALAGKRLHKQNFRRLVERGGMVEGTGERATGTGGRPPELFRFRREVVRERPTPGIGLPGLPG